MFDRMNYVYISETKNKGDVSVSMEVSATLGYWRSAAKGQLWLIIAGWKIVIVYLPSWLLYSEFIVWVDALALIYYNKEALNSLRPIQVPVAPRISISNSSFQLMTIWCSLGFIFCCIQVLSFFNQYWTKYWKGFTLDAEGRRRRRPKRSKDVLLQGKVHQVIVDRIRRNLSQLPPIANYLRSRTEHDSVNSWNKVREFCPFTPLLSWACPATTWRSSSACILEFRFFNFR